MEEWARSGRTAVDCGDVGFVNAGTIAAAGLVLDFARVASVFDFDMTRSKPGSFVLVDCSGGTEMAGTRSQSSDYANPFWDDVTVRSIREFVS